MKKSDKVREALKAAPGSTRDEIVAKSGVDTKYVSTWLSQAESRGEVDREGEKGAYTFTLVEGYTRGASRSAKKSANKGRGAKGAKGKAGERGKLRRIAELARAPSASSVLREAALESLVSSGAHLAATVRAEVEGVDLHPALSHALRSYELAERVHLAAAA